MSRLTLVLAVTALAAPALHAQSTFQGHVVMQMMADDGQATPFDVWVKGSHTRMDANMGGNRATMIYDYSTKTMMMVMPQMKAYMQMPLALDEEGVDEGGARVTRTGRTDQVAGHKCEIFEVQGDSGDPMEVCAATDMGTFMMGGGPMSRGERPSWAAGLKSFFPLRVTDKKKQRAVLEVTKVEPGPVPDSQFAPPAGYRAMAMPGH